MSEHEHNRPWRIDGNRERKVRIIDAGGSVIATLDWFGDDVNAELIVRAVNAHDALVAALEGLNPTEHDCAYCYEAWAEDAIHHAADCALNNALRLAKGKAI